jgi:hypothetical protein
MLEIPEESLKLQGVIANGMSRHTFALVTPSKHGAENRELATGVGVKWREKYLLLTAAHVVDHCPNESLRFFPPKREIQIVVNFAQPQSLTLHLQRLMEFEQPQSPVFADDPVDLAAILLPPQPNADECFALLEENATMPDDGAQVGVFGYPGAARIPADKTNVVVPEQFFGSLDLINRLCLHGPRQDFTVPYDQPHPANGYSGSGVWYWQEHPIWLPEPHLCGIIASECPTDKIVSGFRIETIIKFLQDNDDFIKS